MKKDNHPAENINMEQAYFSKPSWAIIENVLFTMKAF